MCAERNLTKTPYYSPWFSARKFKKNPPLQKIMPYKSPSQEEQKIASFSFISLPARSKRPKKYDPKFLDKNAKAI